jgi:Ankyrin repeat
MPRKRAAKPVSTLVPHRSPELAELLEAAKTCEPEPLRRFLATGGLPDTVVELTLSDGTSIMLPLVFKAISMHCMVQDPAMHHASLELLLQSGANANAAIIAANGHEETALMAACSVACCTVPVRLLLEHGADPGQ